MTPEVKTYADQESKKYYSGIEQSLLDTSKLVKDVAVGKATILIGPVEKKKEVLTDIKDTVKGTAYVFTHLSEVKKSIDHEIDEKGGSYVAGCITGELILTAVGGGSIAKAAKSSESMVGATKIFSTFKKGKQTPADSRKVYKRRRKIFSHSSEA